MPKENVEPAIKRATSKEMGDYKEMVYEGYAPFGIAMVIETATDNTTRTVANVRSYFNKAGGSLGTTGSVDFLFDHKCVFKMTKQDGIDLDELELELIDCGWTKCSPTARRSSYTARSRPTARFRNTSRITATI